MAKKKKRGKKLDKQFVASLVIYLFLLITTITLAIRLLSSQGSKSAIVPDSGTSNSLSSFPTYSPDDVFLELKLLEEYYQQNGLLYPANYETITKEHEKVARLLGGVIENEVTWRSGGYIFISFQGTPQASTNDIDKRKLEAREKIEDYYIRAKEGEDIEKLVEEVNNDPEVKELNKYLSFQLPQFDLFYKSKLFEVATKGSGGITSSENIDNIVFDIEDGVLSEIYEDRLGFAFVVITDSFDSNYDTYDDWLSDVSEGRLNASVVRLTRIRE